MDQVALEAARDISEIPPEWPNVRRVAAIQVIVRKALAPFEDVERLRAALKDIQRESMGVKPPRHSWYYDRAESALS